MAFLNGDRLCLRDVYPSDVNERYHAWMNDREITKYLEVRFRPHSIENILSFVKRLDGNPDEILLAICLHDQGRHIGNIKLGPINHIHRRGDISLFIGEKDYWGKGYATEAISLLKEFAFMELGLRKLTAGAYAANKGSINAFLRNGFEIEGTLKQHCLCGGSYCDVVMLGYIYPSAS